MLCSVFSRLYVAAHVYMYLRWRKNSVFGVKTCVSFSFNTLVCCVVALGCARVSALLLVCAYDSTLVCV